jgi:hypothetical protein
MFTHETLTAFKVKPLKVYVVTVEDCDSRSLDKAFFSEKDADDYVKEKNNSDNWYAYHYDVIELEIE